MSTAEPTSTTDDLVQSLAENVVTTSSDQDTSTSTCHHSNSYDQAMSNVDPEAKKPLPPESDQSSQDKDFHLIKWIEFNYEHLPILLQNVNGPCPLLAIFNILLLRKRVTTIFQSKFFNRIFSLLDCP